MYIKYVHGIYTNCMCIVDVYFFKMRMSEESVSVHMQDFAFKPKERLPNVSRYSQLH